MSASNQLPAVSIACPNCKRDNKIDRPYCKFCGSRLAPRSKHEHDVTQDNGGNGVTSGQGAAPADESLPIESPLETTLRANNDLQLQVSALNQELQSLRVQSGQVRWLRETLEEVRGELKTAQDKALALETLSAGWQKRCQSAEERAAALENQPYSAGEQSIGATPDNPESAQWRYPFARRFLWPVVALVLVLVYILGRYVPGVHATNPRFTEISDQLSDARKQIDSLQTQLNAATKKTEESESQFRSQLQAQSDADQAKINELTKRIAASDNGRHTAETKLAASEQELATARSELSVAVGREQSSATSIQQLQAALTSRESEITSLRQQLANASNKKVARTGVLVWSGVISGSRRIEVKNGLANYGSLSGTLPGVPCIVTLLDSARVKFKTLPGPSNHWMGLSFDAYGSGSVQVKMEWTVQ